MVVGLILTFVGLKNYFRYSSSLTEILPGAKLVKKYVQVCHLLLIFWCHPIKYMGSRRVTVFFTNPPRGRSSPPFFFRRPRRPPAAPAAPAEPFLISRANYKFVRENFKKGHREKDILSKNLPLDGC